MVPDERSYALIPEPPRLKSLRLTLVKAIPKIPNDRATLKLLENKSLGLLLIDFMNWQGRFVGVRRRKVVIDPEMRGDPKCAEHCVAVEALFKKVERGEDLTAHLSILPHTQGVAARAGKQGATAEDKWADKDFILHAMNLHHFHLGLRSEKRGHVERTNEVLFAEVTRDEFRAIGIFDHSVFEHGSPERHKLMQRRARIDFRGHPPGTVLLSRPITTSCHTLHGNDHAQRCMKWVRDIEPKLDDRAFVEGLFRDHDLEAPRRPDFIWGFNHLDFMAFDKVSRRGFIYAQGWN